MFEPILANYTPDGDDWAVEVTAAGKTLTATAPGLIAARDRADQLVEELVPGDNVRTVVHTLDGDAFGFTEAYLSARLAKPADDLASDPAGDSADESADNSGSPAEEAEPAEADKAVTPAPRAAKETPVAEPAG
ncbi:hypothetical protein ACTG9Q_19345 [Actinokineospora sp. 24-640]